MSDTQDLMNLGFVEIDPIFFLLNFCEECKKFGFRCKGSPDVFQCSMFIPKHNEGAA